MGPPRPPAARRGSAAGLAASPRRRRPFPAGAAAVILVLAAVLTNPGCGYRLGGEPGSRFGARGVVVDLRPFTNRSLVPDAGAFLAGRLREEMRRSGFRGGFDRPGADFLVEGAVREVRDEVFSHDPAGFALEHKLTLIVDIRVVEAVRGRLLWRGEGLTETTSYFAGADFQYTESNRRMAFEEACRRVARQIGQTIRAIL